MSRIYSIIEYLWGTPLTVFVVVVGLVLSFSIGFYQITHFKDVWKNTIGKKKDKSIINAALAGTVGAGNIAGIATAIAAGGPGAIFWMWLIAFISMGTKFSEVLLSVKYQKKIDNEYLGGPMYYMKKLKGKLSKVLPIIYSVGLLILVVTDACFVQTNTLATSINETFNIPLWLIGIVLIALSILIISRGFKKVTKIFNKMIPSMCIIYIIISLIVIIANITNVPNSIYLIIKYAFQPAPVVGGFLGASVSAAIAKGAARGIFANEAGMGTSATVHAKTSEKPLAQACWGIVEVFIVSFIICTITALTVLSTNVWMSGETGAVMVLGAYSKVFGSLGKYILCILLVLFTYSTYLGFYVEYKTTIIYLFKEKMYKYLKWFYFVPIIFACVLPIEAIWSIADIAVGIIIIPNLIALLLFSKKIKEILKGEIT